MPTFLALLNYTEKGIQEIGDSPERAEAFDAEAERHGIKVKEQYWTMGSYDGFVLIEAPDEQTAAAMMLSLSSKGRVRSHTLRAFTEDEFKQILARR